VKTAKRTEIIPQTTIDNFLAVDIRVGQVVRAEQFPNARNPAYKLWIDFGDLGIRKSSAQVTKLYTPEELQGRQVLAVVNFPPRQVADFMSEVLVLGVPTGAEGAVVLVKPDREIPAGLRLM
jgi:tRNA-binding protein